MKRIGFLVSDLSGGGAERVVLDIIFNLDRKLFLPVLILLKKDGEYMKRLPADLKIVEISVKCSRVEIFKFSKIVRRVISQQRLNILHSHLTQINTQILLADYVKKFSIPIIVTEHNNFYKKIENKSIFKKPLYKQYLKILYNRANLITAVSDGLKNNLRDILKMHDSKIKVIYNPVDLTKIKQKVKEQPIFIRNDALVNGQRVIVAVGRLTKQKGFDLLIKAIYLSLSKINIKLFILGDGELKNELKDLVDDLELGDNVFFTGFVENPWAEISRADLFVLSSRWEGFGNVIIEAMASGTPVLATECDFGPSEIIKDGENGLLVKPGDIELLSNAIVQIILKKEWNISFVENASKSIQRFSTNVIIGEYQDIYKRFSKHNKS